MFYVYILRSSVNLKYYVGSTKEIANRIEEHNAGECQSTRRGVPWVLIRVEELKTPAEAVRKEKKIKSRGIARYLDDMKNTGSRVAPSAKKTADKLAPRSGVLPKGFDEVITS